MLDFLLAGKGLVLLLLTAGIFAFRLVLKVLNNKILESYYYPKRKGKPVLEAPSDESPLLLAHYLYRARLDQFQDWQKKRASINGIAFEDLIQATILDLVDRRVLKLEEGRLSLIETQGLEKYESLFLDILLGSELAIPMDQLFSDFDLRIKPEEVGKRHPGILFNYEFEYRRKRISEAVDQVIRERGLAELYGDDRSRFWGRSIMEVSKFLISILTKLGLVGFFLGYVLGLRWLEFTLLASILVLANRLPSLSGRSGFEAATDYTENGQRKKIYWPTEEGRQLLAEWSSFKQTLKDFGKLNQKELEDLVLWNRYLVYATLFGESDKLERALAIKVGQPLKAQARFEEVAKSMTE